MGHLSSRFQGVLTTESTWPTKNYSWPPGSSSKTKVPKIIFFIRPRVGSGVHTWCRGVSRVRQLGTPRVRVVAISRNDCRAVRDFRSKCETNGLTEVSTRHVPTIDRHVFSIIIRSLLTGPILASPRNNSGRQGTPTCNCTLQSAVPGYGWKKT